MKRFPILPTLVLAVLAVIGLVGSGSAQTGGAGLTSTRTVETRRQTFNYALNFAGPAGVVLQVQGSATKTVRVKSLALAHPSASTTITLTKRSTANSGGTSSTLTAVPLDSSDDAATATVRAYTVAPTAGTSVGNIAVVSSLGTTEAMSVTFGASSENQELTLRGTAQTLTVSLSSAAAISGSLELLEE